jgi:hypothetical protein
MLLWNYRGNSTESKKLWIPGMLERSLTVRPLFEGQSMKSWPVHPNLLSLQGMELTFLGQLTSFSTDWATPYVTSPAPYKTRSRGSATPVSLGCRPKLCMLRNRWEVPLYTVQDLPIWLYHVCPSAWNISVPTGRILMKFGLWIPPPPRKSVEKIQVLLKLGKSNGYSIRTRVCIYDNISLIYS